MKKILIATNCVFFAIILFQACSITRFTGNNGGFGMGNGSAYASCYNCVVDDLHGETADEFVNVTARYRTTHQELFNKFAKGQLNTSVHPNAGNQVGDDFLDARSCWFSADTLKKFLCLMERYSKEAGIESSHLGVRFYYGVYWANYQRDPNLSNKHTLYLAATQNKTNPAMHQDFDPRATAKLRLLNLSKPDSNVLTVVSIAQQIRNGATNMFIIGGGSGTQLKVASPITSGNIVMNQGDLCPPGKGCDSTKKAIDDLTPSGIYL